MHFRSLTLYPEWFAPNASKLALEISAGRLWECCATITWPAWMLLWRWRFRGRKSRCPKITISNVADSIKSSSFTETGLAAPLGLVRFVRLRRHKRRKQPKYRVSLVCFGLFLFVGFQMGMIWQFSHPALSAPARPEWRRLCGLFVWCLG